MIFRYALSIFSLFLFSCTSDSGTSDAPKVKVSNTNISNAHFTGSPIDASTFQAIRGDSLQKMLIRQFCDESKGYRKDTWLGLNKCSWAMEKYLLNQTPDITKRNNRELSIQLSNGEKESFFHKNLDTDSPTFFQFKKYFEGHNLVLIEQMNKDACMIQLFIRQSDGQTTPLSGTLFLSPDGKSFILNGGEKNCQSTIEYWTIAADQVTQKWSEDFPEGKISEIRWIDQQNFVARLQELKKAATIGNYLKFQLH